jgi:hypothetical protein
VSVPVPQPLVNLQTNPSQQSFVSSRWPSTYLFHISPKTPAPLGIVCSSQLALRAAALSLAGPRFISVILLNLVVSDCWFNVSKDSNINQTLWCDLTGRRLPASWDALFGASIEALPMVESVEVLVVESMVCVGCIGNLVVFCVVSTRSNVRLVWCAK